MTAVASNERFCAPDTFSTGRLKSLAPANTRPHLSVGAQKWTVLGPVGEFHILLNMLFIVALDMSVCVCVCACALCVLCVWDSML